MRNFTDRMLARRDTAFSAMVLAVAAFCAGCMTIAPRMHVDELAEWHKAHGEALPAFLSATADQHVAAARTHIRERLTVRKVEMANKLHRIALERIAACGPTSERVGARNKVTCLRQKIGDAEADGLSRIANVPHVYRLIRDLSVAEEKYWIGVAQRRLTCTTDIQQRLKDALDELDEKLETILSGDPKEVSRLPVKWLRCKVGVKWQLKRPRWYIDELKKCKSPLRGDCNDPNAAPHLAKSPLRQCLGILTSAPNNVEEAISAGEKQLAQEFRRVAGDLVPMPDMAGGQRRGASLDADCKGQKEDVSSSRAATRPGRTAAFAPDLAAFSKEISE